MVRFWKVLQIVAILLIICKPAFANQYTVLTEELPPVHFRDNGVIKGIATEIVQEIFKEAGLEPKLMLYPWKRSYSMTLKEKNTFIYTINRTEKREKLFKWIGPILSKETSIYKLRKRTDIQIHELEDAKKYKTAVILGHSLTSKLVDHGFQEGKELITTLDKEKQVKLFLKGHSDLVTGNQYTIYRSLKSAGHSIEEVEPVLLMSTKGYYLGANLETDESIIQKLEQANEKVKNSGIVLKLIKKYMH